MVMETAAGSKTAKRGTYRVYSRREGKSISVRASRAAEGGFLRLPVQLYLHQLDMRAASPRPLLLSTAPGEDKAEWI
jgi:hypothetical protein